VFWHAGSAQLLPRLLAGRTGEPVFLAGRRPTRAIAELDLDPVSGQARLSYRRAAELFHARTGWTLHQLRHSALTHAAEDCTNLPMLLARSRHASVRSLERYARPGPEAIARHLAETDPARRRNDLRRPRRPAAGRSATRYQPAGSFPTMGRRHQRAGRAGGRCAGGPPWWAGRPRTRPDHLTGDKAYSSRANRTALRARHIPHTIPERDDQEANRARRGARGGRPPVLTGTGTATGIRRSG
jgi:hypothetical protein